MLDKRKKSLFVFLYFCVKEKIIQSKMQQILNKLQIFIEDKKKFKKTMRIIKQMMKMIYINC